MRRFVVGLACVLLGAVVVADTYRVRVTRIERNLYLTDEKVLIETRYCSSFARREEAILQWEGRTGTNWIIFLDSKEKCDVVAVR